MNAALISIGSRCASGRRELRPEQRLGTHRRRRAGPRPPPSSVPMNANATPTEQMIRYFHIASSDCRRRMQRRSGRRVTSVVASMPTHMMPRLFDTSTSIIAASAPNHSAPKRRAAEGERVVAGLVCEIDAGKRRAEQKNEHENDHVKGRKRVDAEDAVRPCDNRRPDERDVARPRRDRREPAETAMAIPRTCAAEQPPGKRSAPAAGTASSAMIRCSGATPSAS